MASLLDFTGKVQSIIDKWDEIKEDWFAIFEERDLDEHQASRVITVLKAQQIIEKLRTGELKEKAEAIYDQIKSIWGFILHPVSGSAEGDKALLAGAAAFAGKPGAGAGALSLANVVDGVLLFLDRVIQLEDQIIALVKLFDLVGDLEDQVEGAALQQGNPQTLVDGPRSMRHPR